MSRVLIPGTSLEITPGCPAMAFHYTPLRNHGTTEKYHNV